MPSITRVTTGGLQAFRRVWLGATVSSAGDAASWIALVALTLGTPHGSVAVLAICYTAPVAVGGLAAGWALDRFDRRRLLMADATLRAAVFIVIPVSAGLSGAVPLPVIDAVAAVYGLLKMISLAGFPALIPQLVADDQLSRANALEGASYGLASLAGAGLGGLVIGAFGQGGAIGLILADAVSYLVFAAALRAIRLRPIPPATDATGNAAAARSTSTSVTAVVRLVLARPVLRTITAMFALFNIGEGMLLVFLPHRSAAIGLGAGGYGYLVAALTGGELAAAALLARRGLEPAARAFHPDLPARRGRDRADADRAQRGSHHHRHGRARIRVRTDDGVGADAANARGPVSHAWQALRRAQDRHAGDTSDRRGGGRLAQPVRRRRADRLRGRGDGPARARWSGRRAQGEGTQIRTEPGCTLIRSFLVFFLAPPSSS